MVDMTSVTSQTVVPDFGDLIVLSHKQGTCMASTGLFEPSGGVEELTGVCSNCLLTSVMRLPGLVGTVKLATQ
jgi:hypothetical protein